MAAHGTDSHGPPTLGAQQVEALIRSSRPPGRGVVLARRFVPLLVMVVAVGLLLAVPPGAPVWRQLAPMGLLVCVLGYTAWFSWRVRRAHRLHSLALQAVQMSQWPTAWRVLRQLLSRPMDSLELRISALLILAELCTQAQLHEQTVALCEEVLAGPVDSRSQQVALVEKALGLLGAERLTDANVLIDRFRQMEFAEPVGALAALAGLYRNIQARSYGEAAAQADSVAPRCRRHLQRRAAYAYGLLALALEQVGQPERAQRYYDCATRLMSPAELAHRFAELGGLEDRLVPARSPL